MNTPANSHLIEALKDVEDPEIPINIVDMGLVVDVRTVQSTVEVDITLTAMGCPGVDMIVEGIRSRLLQEPNVEEVKVEIVWEPIWTKQRLTEEGRAQMREWGISV
jgi:metal-sulfur cluster biosynthetic enzyme